ncbi:MAG: TetR/AcrR family transcriptional regulator C-terminal domain-containing protein [Gaiellaceae bacterium]
MRRLGLALGVEAMSLYNHVGNKDDVLSGMSELVMAEIDLPATAGDWEADVRACAIATHEALLRHPWACNLAMSRYGFGTARMQHMEWILSRLRDAGFPPELTYHAYHAIDSHIFGFTLWQLGHDIGSEDVKELGAVFLRRLPVDDYPYLHEHAVQHIDGNVPTTRSSSGSA